MIALTIPKEIPSFGKTALFISLNDLTHYVLFAGIACIDGQAALEQGSKAFGIAFAGQVSGRVGEEVRSGHV